MSCLRTKLMFVPVYLSAKVPVVITQLVPDLKLVGEVTGKDVIVGVAAVGVRVRPGRAELVAGIAGLWCTALHRYSFQLDEGLVRVHGRVLSIGSRARGGLDSLEGVGRNVASSQEAANRTAVSVPRDLTANG